MQSFKHVLWIKPSVLRFPRFLLFTGKGRESKGCVLYGGGSLQGAVGLFLTNTSNVMECSCFPEFEPKRRVRKSKAKHFTVNLPPQQAAQCSYLTLECKSFLISAADRKLGGWKPLCLDLPNTSFPDWLKKYLFGWHGARLILLQPKGTF